MLLGVQETLRLSFVGLGHFNSFKFMLVLFHVKHNFSIWHLRNLATLEPKIANVPGSKVKLLAHCCHDSVESLISTSDHTINMHTEHSMDCSTYSKNKCTWIESTTREFMFDERFLESVPPFLWRIYQSVHRLSQSQYCFMIKIEHFVSRHRG